jgi:hypothetical protein
LNIALAAKQALTSSKITALISALAKCTGRPIDLIDLKEVSKPLLRQIARHGRRILGSDT